MVIITDVVQCLIIISGVCYVAYLSIFGSVLGSASDILEFAGDSDRLNWFGRDESLLKNMSFYVKEGSLSLFLPTLFIIFIRSTGQENIQRLLAVRGGAKNARKAHVIVNSQKNTDLENTLIYFYFLIWLLRKLFIYFYNTNFICRLIPAIFSVSKTSHMLAYTCCSIRSADEAPFYQKSAGQRK